MLVIEFLSKALILPLVMQPTPPLLFMPPSTESSLLNRKAGKIEMSLCHSVVLLFQRVLFVFMSDSMGEDRSTSQAFR